MQAKDRNGRIFDVDTDRAYILEVQNIYPTNNYRIVAEFPFKPPLETSTERISECFLLFPSNGGKGVFDNLEDCGEEFFEGLEDAMAAFKSITADEPEENFVQEYFVRREEWG